VQVTEAIYVHLQPEVPANVLPLGIKAPFIPLAFMLLAGLNLFQLLRSNGRGSDRHACHHGTSSHDPRPGETDIETGRRAARPKVDVRGATSSAEGAVDEGGASPINLTH
jgi:hypothetical protein